jgi:hypothetical protein
MKAVTPITLLMCLGAAFLVYANSTVGQLPDRVATHFGAGGAADGWMTREGYHTFVICFGVGLPLFILGTGYIARLLPGMLNIPNKIYWLAPERRDESFSFICMANAWIACLVMMLIFGIHYLTLQANTLQPPHLPMDQFLPILGAFLVAMAIWLVIVVAHFKRPATDQRLTND